MWVLEIPFRKILQGPPYSHYPWRNPTNLFLRQHHHPHFTDQKTEPQRSTCLKSPSCWNQAPSLSGSTVLRRQLRPKRSHGFVETPTPGRMWSWMWRDLYVCILFPMKCLFTAVGHLEIDFNEKDDVLISYIEIHMNFGVLKICNWKQLLFKKIKVSTSKCGLQVC